MKQSQKQTPPIDRQLIERKREEREKKMQDNKIVKK